MDNSLTQLILKEIDLIDNTISRLDKQIQTSKNICVTLWTTWLGWFISQQITECNKENYGLVILASAIFPIIFWLVDFEYRRALLRSSKRQSIISLYLNDKIDDNSNNCKKFPVLDPLGSLYDFKIQYLIAKYESELSESKKNNENNGTKKKKKSPFQQKNWLDILFYKEAKWIFSPLILLSIITGIIFCVTYNCDI